MVDISKLTSRSAGVPSGVGLGLGVGFLVGFGVLLGVGVAGEVAAAVGGDVSIKIAEAVASGDAAADKDAGNAEPGTLAPGADEIGEAWGLMLAHAISATQTRAEPASLVTRI